MRIIILSLISLAVAVNENLVTDLVRDLSMEIAKVADDDEALTDDARIGIERDIGSKYITRAQDEISGLLAMIDTLDMSGARPEGITELEQELPSRQVFLRELVGGFDYEYEVFPAEPLKGLGRILRPLAEIRPMSADELDRIRNEFAEFVQSENVPQAIARHVANVVHSDIYRVLDGPAFDDGTRRYVRIVNQIGDLERLIESIEAEYL